MAVWTTKPAAGRWSITYVGPKTLTSEFEDGSVSVREKSSVTLRVFSGTFTGSTAEIRAMLDLFDVYRHTTTLTIYTFDPQAFDPDTDEATVRFWGGKPEPHYVAPFTLAIDVVFREEA